MKNTGIREVPEYFFDRKEVLTIGGEKNGDRATNRKTVVVLQKNIRLSLGVHPYIRYFAFSVWSLSTYRFWSAKCF